MKKIAIITGPTSGIGEAFAHKLAKQGFHLVLIARRKEKLHELSNQLSNLYNTTVNYIMADLSIESDIKQTEDRLKELPNVDLLINNAGFGIAGFFNDVPLEEQLRMINVHLASTVRFCKAVLPGMIEKQSGAIINVASFAAFMELPGSVMYSTTKAALIKFSQTLHNEVSPLGIKIQALSPGFTPTGFHTAIRRDSSVITNSVPDFLWTSVQKVVDTSLAELNSNSVICIPGKLNSILFWMNKSSLISRWIHHVANKKRRKALSTEPHSIAT